MRILLQRAAMALIVLDLSLTGATSAAAAALRDAPAVPVSYALYGGRSVPAALGQTNTLTTNTLTLRGVLSLRPFRTNDVWVAYFQDDTGALRLSDRHARRFGNFDEGDQIVVRGVLTGGNDGSELRVEDAQMIRNGEAPRPRDVWTADLRNNRFASQLVRIVGEFSRGSDNREPAFYVRDATGETPIVLKPEFLMTDKGEFSYRLWKGGETKIAGIAYRDTNAPAGAGLSLLVRRPSDVEFIPPPPPPPPPPSPVPLYTALGAAAFLALLSLYFWERRRVAEQRAREVSKLLHELKRSQVEIKKQAAFAQLNPNPVLELFADGTITYWNDAARGMARALRCKFVPDILPKNVQEIVHECHTTKRAREGCEVKSNGRTISWSFFPIPEITSVHAYGHDITDHLSLEAQLRQAQKIESVGQLAAGIAHDFNNLLAVMQGYTSMTLMRGDLPEAVAEPLNEILSAAERAGNLTRQLLLFSRKQQIELRTLDLNDVVANLTKMLRRLLGEDVRLRFVRAENGAWVHADPGMVEQVIVNLALNGRDAMPDGGELFVSLGSVVLEETDVAQRLEARAGDFVCINVTDTGGGMDEATLKRLFEPFFTTKEPGKGTGLGLATAHGIVKQHEGWIEVDSHPGKGSTFRVYFPAAAAAPKAGENKVIRLPVAGGTETILLVEDDAAVRKLARSALEEYGYGVLEAGSANEAIAIWRESHQRICLLLTDLVLPDGMSGWKLAKTLHAENNQLKVIYSTGFDAEALNNRRADPQNKSILLRKPYPVQLLVQTVRECLDNAPTPQDDVQITNR